MLLIKDKYEYFHTLGKNIDPSNIVLVDFIINYNTNKFINEQEEYVNRKISLIMAKILFNTLKMSLYKGLPLELQFNIFNKLTPSELHDFYVANMYSTTGEYIVDEILNHHLIPSTEELLELLDLAIINKENILYQTVLKTLNLTLDDLMREAVKYDKLNIIRNLINNGVSKDVGLIAAGESNNLNLVKYFIDHGANKLINILYISADRGYFELFNYITEKLDSIENDVAISYEDVISEATQAASKNNHMEIMDILLEKYGDNSDLISDAALKGALLGNHTELILRLAGDYRREFNNTMFIVAELNLKEWLDYFIERGGNLDMGLCGAANSDNLELVKYFIDMGAREASFALKYAHDIPVIEYLLERGAFLAEYELLSEKRRYPEKYAFIVNYYRSHPRTL